MATHLCTPVCAERFEMSCAGGYESELPEALQAVLRREFSVVQQQLEMLARGQAALHVNVEKLRTQVGSTLKSDEPLPNNSANTDDAKLLDEEKKRQADVAYDENVRYSKRDDTARASQVNPYRRWGQRARACRRREVEECHVDRALALAAHEHQRSDSRRFGEYSNCFECNFHRCQR
mmetsp:Transcript_12896/g.24342  ORF Transcript_12896/g.24342 Transcript_12896/m.24342 type:complete len:178 (+) Transcript_12896:41-574(+)